MAEKGSAPLRAVDAGINEEYWRKVHPISPVLNTWQVFAALSAFLVYQYGQILSSLSVGIEALHLSAAQISLGVLGIVIIVVAISALYSWLAWRATSWAITDEAVWYRSGILFRTQRHARLERIQEVEVSHPLLGRMFGLGRLKIEVAGGADSNLLFGYLRTADLDNARREILALAAGLRLERTVCVPGVNPLMPDSGEGGVSSGRQGDAYINAAAEAGVAGSGVGAPGAPGADRAASLRGAALPDAPERPLYEVPVGRLLVSLLLSGVTLTILLSTVALIVFFVIAFSHVGWASLNALWGMFGGFAGALTFMWSRFAGEFGFKAAVSPDGIRVRRGLTDTRAQTIPPRRVHAIRISRPLLWRRLGWYRVTILKAGATVDHNEENSQMLEQVLLPVGTREEAELALWLVVRDLGVPDPHSFLEEAFNGKNSGQWFRAAPPSAKIIDPIVQGRRAFALTDTVLAIRNGRIYQTLVLAPVERLQSATIDQGPILRQLGLANVRMDLVAGLVKAKVLHIDVASASVLSARLVEMSRQRRAAEPPEHWMARVVQAIGPEQGHDGDSTPQPGGF